MPTIDKLDIGIYMQYARRTQMLEEISHEYHLGEAGSIPPHLQVVDLSPRMTEVDSLLGASTVRLPWAFFFAPPRYRDRRSSPFGFSRIVPSLGSFEDEEEDEERLEWAVCETDEEREEKEILKRCFAEIKKINGWLTFIVGRIGQFLQG